VGIKIKMVAMLLMLAGLSAMTVFAGESLPVSGTETVTMGEQGHSSKKIDIVGMLKKATMGTNVFYALLLAFLAGILVSFTPCVYPMIPITVGILQAQARDSMLYNFFSALSYVFGISLVYASLGYVSATTSVIFGRWLASPWFIIMIVLFFLYLAFSLFGFYELHIPSILRRRTEISARSSLFHSFLFGALSGTVASPCLTPALAIMLGIAAKTGNPVLGFLYLLFFSFGMGTMLLLVGTFSGALHLLPQAGFWMEEVKRAFGFIMLMMCVHFLSPLLQSDVILELHSMILLGASVYYFCTARHNRIKLLLGLFLFLLSIALLAIAIKSSIRFGV
jgi:thiol:disulfide interchange protein DsbD